MIAEEYLAGSRLFRRLKNGSHGQLIERCAARLVDDGLAQGVALRSLRLIGDFMKWMASSGFRVAEVDEPMVERFLHVRARKRSNYSGDRPALKRFLSVLRDAGMISSAEPPQITPEDQILADFCDYLRRERGLAPRSIDRHLPGIRRLLCEVCPAGAKDLGKINHANVLRYVERHARDGSPSSGRVMCWSLRAFFRYLYHKGLNPLSLAGCVPSIRRWKLANLPTYLSAEQVRKVLDSCDRATASAQPSSPTYVMLALSLRVAAYFSARPLPTSAFHFLAQSRRSQRPLSLMPASGASHTKGLIPFATASPPSFSGPVRHCRRSASCWDTRVTTQPASMPRWTSIRSGL